MSGLSSLGTLSMQSYEEARITLQIYENIICEYEKQMFNPHLREKLKEVRKIIEKSINNHCNGETFIFTAVRIGDTQTLQRLLCHGAQTKGYCVDNCSTILHYAIRYQKYECIKQIVQKKPDLLREKTLEGLSPYQYSNQFTNILIQKYLKTTFEIISEKFSMKNNDEVKKIFWQMDGLLIEQEAAQKRNRTLPLHKQDELDSLREILIKGLNERDEEGYTPLMDSANAGDIDTFRRLLDLGADVTICEPEFESSLLHIAVLGQSKECVLEILKRHPDLINVKDKRGFKAMQYAQTLESDEIKELLKQYSSDNP